MKLKSNLVLLLAITLCLVSVPYSTVFALDRDTNDIDHGGVSEKEEVNVDLKNTGLKTGKLDTDENTVTITFHTNGGMIAQDVISVEKGTHFNPYDYIPTKDGKAFYAWFQDENLENKYYGGYMNNDINLYAKWSEVVSEEKFSDDMLEYLAEVADIKAPIGKLSLEEITNFSNFTNVSYYDVDNDVDVDIDIIINDFKGIEFLANIEQMDLYIDLNNRISSQGLDEIAKLQNISYIKFSALLPKEYRNDWNLSENFNARNLSDSLNVSKYEDEIVSYLNAISIKVNESNDANIDFDGSLYLTDQSFMTRVNSPSVITNMNLTNGEFGGSLFIKPEETQRNGETYYKIFFKNTIKPAYKDIDSSFVVDDNYKYVETTLDFSFTPFLSGDESQDEIDKLESPLYLSYTDLNDNLVETDSQSVDRNAQFKDLTLYLNEVQYENIVEQVRALNGEVQMPYSNPGNVMSLTSYFSFPEEELESNGGHYPEFRNNYYTRYNYILDIEIANVENKFIVTFDSKGGSAVDPQTVLENTVATQPTMPIKAGYTFGGWYTDAATTTAYDFATPVTGDITLYAKWDKVDDETPVTPIDPTEPTDPANPEVILPSTGQSQMVMEIGIGILLLGLFFVMSGFTRKDEN